MRIEHVKIEQKPQFKPFAITIIFEDLDEVLSLWHRLNFGTLRIKELVDSSLNVPCPISHCSSLNKLWTVMDRKLKDLEIR